MTNSAATAPPEHPATVLRRRFEDPEDFVLAPGVYDGLSARVALEVGFDALYMTGAGTAASRLGQPDIGLAELSDMSAQADMLANLDTRVPLLADMDTGYGGAGNVARSVRAYVRAGVAAFHIEDQVQQKRCGHLANKAIVDRGVFAMRIRAAVAARRAKRSDIVVIARTDCLASMGYDEALARLKEARDIGADAGLLEGPDSEETMERIVKDLAPWPVVLNMVEKGRTPTVSVKRAKEIGYRCVIWSFAGLVPALLALRQAYSCLKETGLIEGKKLSPKEVFEVCGLGEWMRVESEAGGAVFTNGV